ncbi:hypothetical protein [Dyadobacter sp. CY312]|uniref:hypothetical protein n=1 Tax=Dyadobacter sp. CY312 TaxID=2907303 RepID=UPI001F48EC0E|nr:hypothetical protein [Dyadobacter sp. CY312]MCE7043440.1 hypothetical protein [Dyadobacter sp. CY312]
MKQITPYRTVDEALTSLDNGGRFYNIFTREEDGTIAQAELAKVAGLFNEKQKLILFLDLSLSQLDTQSRESVISKLDDQLRVTYKKYKPIEMTPSEVNVVGTKSSNIIVTGIPEMKESKNYFSGMILVPIGKAFVPIPISDMYTVYEIKDEQSSEMILIAHAKGSEKLPEKRIKVGGVLKEVKPKKNEKVVVEQFLEINYFLDLD